MLCIELAMLNNKIKYNLLIRYIVHVVATMLLLMNISLLPIKPKLLGPT